MDRTALEYTIEGLESIQPICQRNLFGSELQSNLPLLKAKLKLPVVSMGILYWIRSNFLDPNYYLTTYGALSTPMHIDLLREICSNHPLQHPAILDLLVKTFEMEPELEALAAVRNTRHSPPLSPFLNICAARFEENTFGQHHICYAVRICITSIRDNRTFNSED